jgi:pSer/pThr/pTyr-binding forkhead associated (FHA) protein
MAFDLTLTFMSGHRDGEKLYLSLDEVRPALCIGRLPENDLYLPDDPEVSRRHARLYWQNGLWLEDLGSSNGCFVGEFEESARVKGKARLEQGTIFRIGLTRFQVSLDHPTESCGKTAIAEQGQGDRHSTGTDGDYRW